MLREFKVNEVTPHNPFLLAFSGVFNHITLSSSLNVVRTAAVELMIKYLIYSSHF